MKNWTKITAIALISFSGLVSRGHAATVYTNSALNGCYSFLLTSRDAPPLDQAAVGTICFDGKGNIVPSTSGGEDQTGWTENTDGVVISVSQAAGTYSVTNTPGQGMGTFVFASGSGACGTYAFSLHTVNSTTKIASGFQFALVSSANCGDVPKVTGGTALRQP